MTGKNATETLPADAEGIARAVAILESDGLVAVPTETVYGLAARADRPEAVAKIYAAKGRPSFNPLIVHVADRAAAGRLVEFDDRAQRLADAFWPGPLTLVLPLRPDSGLAGAVTAGLPTLAVRVPDHPVMLELLRRLGSPLAAPSANASETVSPTSAAHVRKTLEGRIDAVIDAGETRRGVESTIVALREGGSWSLLREGPISAAEIAALFGREAVAASGSVEAPGQMARHYAPGKPMRLDAIRAEEDEFLLGFGSIAGDWSLSRAGDLAEAAARLYAGLHVAAEADQPRIAVAPIPDDGIGRAINDRLRRAAA
ncbi:threonylcarbamoyl-AMP synthase [Erythrobacter sp. SDW2]|uniref:L-threonylcarbamoyladenylate synthase n=1 Tax=Erythrobacter sp. SDW2 TaxID=2907154 RepID=UPI001F476310|nr:L-threonylcarbamoyladenylate synthase [Erythrobacter sp. SDW2]UIP07332.1 threonylcarbamoyl-AMP synthase [Erythrobacter sp. SDW2]